VTPNAPAQAGERVGAGLTTHHGSIRTLDELDLLITRLIARYGPAIAPHIPTFAEMGLPTISYSMWFGLFTPRRTPRNIIDKLNSAAAEAMHDPALRSP
jgi:tripartite-type tricarboxylate transporter receptor subunit TctC